MTTVWFVEILTTDGINFSAKSANDAGILWDFDIVEKFNINRIIKSGAKYDYDKAKWFNSEHIKKIDSNILINENKDEIIKSI